MSNLQSLDLHRNNLSGTISNRLGQLTNLYYLDLQHNHLSGEIPESIGSCSELIRLNLSNNEFRGELPSTLPLSLQEVRVDRNDLSGSLPLDTIRNLKHLHADILFSMIKSDEDSKTSLQNEDRTRRSSAGSQGSSRPAVHIEMGDITMSGSLNKKQSETPESKSSSKLGETPFKL